MTEQKDQRLQKLICETVQQLQGCKCTELVTKNSIWQFSLEEIYRAIDYLASIGELLVINYTLPTMREREKTYLFPGGTSWYVLYSGNS